MRPAEEPLPAERTQYVSLTAGMANALRRSRLSDRVCSVCEMGFPVYPGRYPTKCPRCGGAVERRERITEADHIPGGRADTRRPEDFDPVELALGIRHEMEHTDDPDIAREIAMDHLTEDPHYYTKLAAGVVPEAGGTVGSVGFDIAPSEQDGDLQMDVLPSRTDLLAIANRLPRAVATRASSGVFLWNFAEEQPARALVAAIQAAFPGASADLYLRRGARAPYEVSAIYEHVIEVASGVPRLQRLISAGAAGPGPYRDDLMCSPARAVPYAVVEDGIAGGVQGMMWFLEGPTPTHPPRYYRLEGIDAPVLVFEFDEGARQLRIFATTAPSAYLGWDPRGDLIAEAVAREIAADPTMSESKKWDAIPSDVTNIVYDMQDKVGFTMRDLSNRYGSWGAVSAPRANVGRVQKALAGIIDLGAPDDAFKFTGDPADRGHAMLPLLGVARQWRESADRTDEVQKARQPDGWVYLHGLTDKSFPVGRARYSIVSIDRTQSPSVEHHGNVDSFTAAKAAAGKLLPNHADRVEVWDDDRGYMVAFKSVDEAREAVDEAGGIMAAASVFVRAIGGRAGSWTANRFGQNAITLTGVPAGTDLRAVARTAGLRRSGAYSWDLGRGTRGRIDATPHAGGMVSITVDLNVVNEDATPAVTGPAGITNVVTEKPDGAGGPTSDPKEPGAGATRIHGGHRFEIGYNKKRKPRKNVELSIQNRLNARRGLAARIRAAKKWHRGHKGGQLHRDLGHYNTGNGRGESFWDVVLPAALEVVGEAGELRFSDPTHGPDALASIVMSRLDLPSSQRARVMNAIMAVWKRGDLNAPDAGLKREVYAIWRELSGLSNESVAEDMGQTDRTIDDVLDAILRRLITIESTDVLQDVEFADDGAIYLFFDPILTAKEVDEIIQAVRQEAEALQLVGSPDKSLPGENVKSDWWVVYVPPIGEDAAAAQPDPEMYAAEPPPPGATAPKTMVVTAAPSSIDQIALSVDIDKLIAALGKAEAPPEPGPAEGRVLPLWAPPGGRELHLRGVDEVGKLLAAATAGRGRLFLIHERSYDAAVATVGRGRLRNPARGVWTNLADPGAFVAQAAGGRRQA